MTFFLIPITIAQDPPPPPEPSIITGCWEVTVNVRNIGWDGVRSTETVYETFTIEDFDETYWPVEVEELPTPQFHPNFIINFPATTDDFVAWIYDRTFTGFKWNSDNCVDLNYPNWGREMIMGTINKIGTTLRGKGMGFDAHHGCASSWSYTFEANKISEEECEQ